MQIRLGTPARPIASICQGGHSTDCRNTNSKNCPNANSKDGYTNSKDGKTNSKDGNMTNYHSTAKSFSFTIPFCISQSIKYKKKILFLLWLCEISIIWPNLFMSVSPRSCTFISLAALTRGAVFLCGRNIGRSSSFCIWSSCTRILYFCI